ncbi:FxSxx-COOH system tetratricopeptide repeat protein [Micromonospora echinofusca]|uniref:FxSxx-COOH system tetratricopeptide repeat protein n=1 Tax=Micromonospora echinofusca TaxID=47858 RepID=UPI0033FC5C90
MWAWWHPIDWRFPKLGWAETEQAGWVAGILGAGFALASLVFDRIDRRHERRPTSAAVGGVVRVGRVPEQAAWFQERHVRIDLVKAAKAGRTAVLSQVLSGMGGVGKTQLAAQFARRLDAGGELEVLVWVTASSRDAIIAAYAEAAWAVGVASAEMKPESAAERLLAWLEHTRQRWLIVLDNLDTPADAAGLWPPGSRHGRTVITTRRRDPVLHTNGRTLVEVDLFAPAEAANYLIRATGADNDEHAEIDALAADLGYLPLAMAQAAAFIRDRGIDAATYRQRLADCQQPLAALAPPDDALPDDYGATVAATWSLSVDAADNHPPRGLARPVLGIAALLDPNGIPHALFTTDAVIQYLTFLWGRDVNPQAVTDALRNLHRLSLISHDPSSGTARVHALVQRATRDELTSARLAAAARATADGLLDIWPYIDRDPEFAQRLRANTTALRSNSGDGLLYGEAHPLLFRSIDSLSEAGQVAAVAAAAKQLLAECTRVLGPDHPDTLTTRDMLGRVRGEAGDPAAAAAAYERLLADYVRVLGPDHLHTLATRNNLARWQGEAGDPAGAAAAYEQLLSDRLKLFEPDHPDTLVARNNLAFWSGKAGAPAAASAAFERLLSDRQRVLGADHPHTLATRHNLAWWQGKAGDPAGAAAAYEQIQADYVRVLGPDHPQTLMIRSHLAAWRGAAGDLPGAVADFEQLLADYVRVLGPDHPQSRMIRNNLAALAATGRGPVSLRVFPAILVSRFQRLGSGR